VHGPAERGQQRFRAGEVLGAAADHDRQRRGLGAAGAAADRRVQRRVEGVRKPSGQRRRPRRHVDQGDVVGELRGNLLDRLRRGEREDRDVGARGGLGRARCGPGSKGLHPVGVEIAPHHLMPGGDEVGGHRQPHRPEADEGDAGHSGRGRELAAEVA
jgi:hypothetical protein